MSLAQRSVKSSTYTITASAIQTAVQFIRSVILARILAPEDFGVYAFAFSFIVFTKSVPLFGLSAALIHRAPESEGEPANRAHFTLTALFTVVWGFLVAISALVLASPTNRIVIWVILLTQVIDNLTQTGQAILAKMVKLQRVALLQVISTLISTTTALSMAWLGFGVWSLVSTDIVEAIIPLAGYYLIRPVWKTRLGLRKDTARYFLQFGQKAFISGLLQDMLDNLDNLWTGQFLGKTALGFYSRAYTFATYPRKVLATPLASVSTGTYAELKEQRKRLSQAFFRANALLVRVGFFFSGLLALLAPEFIQLVIGVKWMPMLTAFRLMLIYTLLDPLKITLSGVFIAVGKPEITVRIRLVQLVTLIAGLLLLTTRFGIAGTALSVDVMIVVGIVLLLVKARQFVDFSPRQLFAVPGLALGIGLLAARALIDIPGVGRSPWVTGSIKGFTFTILYSVILLILEHKQIPMMLGMLKLIRKIEKQPDE